MQEMHVSVLQWHMLGLEQKPSFLTTTPVYVNMCLTLLTAAGDGLEHPSMAMCGAEQSPCFATRSTFGCASSHIYRSQMLWLISCF